MVRPVVVDKDYGFKDIMKILSDLDYKLRVGFQDGDITHYQVDSNYRVKQPGESMADIAAQNEFGTRKIPERSFMRTAFDENIADITTYFSDQLGLVIDKAQNIQQALGLTGQLVTGLIQRKIRQIVIPPNAPFTIIQKGSSKPLIDFGQMIQSVRYVIIK